MKKSLKTLIFLGTTVLLSACNDDDQKQDSNSIVNEIRNPVVNLTAYSKDGMPNATADSQLMTYKMLGVDNKEVQATALVFVPKTAQPAKGWSIVVWAHGTTGVADKCAPSEQGLQGTELLLQQLLAAGYVVVAPDYEGLGSTGNHPFLNLKSEAFSITDAVVATHDYLSRQGMKVSPEWIAMGHSQGGHAALGAAQYASRANLDYKGTIAIAPASNLAVILESGEDAVKDQPSPIQIPVLAPLDTFTSLIVAGMQGHQISVSYAEVFKDHTAKIAPSAEVECSVRVGEELAAGMIRYTAFNSGSLNGYGRTQDNFMTIPVISNFLVKDSQPATVKLNQPVIIYQGSADTTVPKLVTDQLVLDAKKLGTQVDYRTDEDALTPWTHSSVYSDNFSQFIADVKTLMPIQ